MKTTMTALFDRKGNNTAIHPIYQGEIFTVWRDEDFRDMWFVEDYCGNEFGMEGKELEEVFGYRPDEVTDVNQ